MGGDQGLTGAALAGLLEAQGFDFFTGVPCSMIEGLIATLETHPRLPYVPAVREDVAVGLAAGAWMAGRHPMVLTPALLTRYCGASGWTAASGCTLMTRPRAP